MSATGVPARLAAIATSLPETRLGNDELAQLYPGWPAEKMFEKTGILERRIAAPEETAVDLGIAACRQLFADCPRAAAADFLIFCTQAPDYILPTSACVMQERLGLPTSIGALDINLGCSGFVYGLSLAAGLIAAGSASRILLVTADTYSKYIHPHDRSVRTLFGDGAAATLVEAPEAGDPATVGPFVFGTDGSGARSLIVEAGGFRMPSDATTRVERTDRSGNVRTPEHLYMDGAAVMSFTLREVPRALASLFARTQTTLADYDHVVLHQANRFMLDALQKKLDIPDAKLPRLYERIGNTVGSTIPFVLADLSEKGQLTAGTRVMLVGFGVGLSWAAAAVTC